MMLAKKCEQPRVHQQHKQPQQQQQQQQSSSGKIDLSSSAPTSWDPFLLPWAQEMAAAAAGATPPFAPFSFGQLIHAQQHFSNSASLRKSSLNPFGDPADKFFGINCFDERAMAKELSQEAFQRFQTCLQNTEPIPADLADEIAAALLRWAQARGVTHYTHWFQPINNAGGEKHDTFLELGERDIPIHRFTGKHLSQGEPDGSSFPSGGLRSTAKARAYTVWDPSSPPFVSHHSNGATLYLPSVFVSWELDGRSGRTLSLDEKLPQMRSSKTLRTHLLHLLGLLNPEPSQRRHREVRINCGIEQEFFIIDRKLWVQRPDLVSCGRTIIGAMPPRGQELDDSYFGHQTRAILDCVHDLEVECWKLGIPIQTRHREVAPGQYEVAPQYLESNVGADQNLLLMDILRDVCLRHGCAALLHEKPFAGLNGSGKHNNWSVGTDLRPCFFQTPTPEDLLRTPELGLEFPAIICAFLIGVDEHYDLLRISVACAGNDHRLGMQEAPPAIISVYLGEEVTEKLLDFMRTWDPLDDDDDDDDDVVVGNDDGDDDDEPQEFKTPGGGGERRRISSNPAVILDMGCGSFPEVRRDSTDRNRTSPLAFIGNRFEFRAVGSSQNVSRSTTALNVVLADGCAQLSETILAAWKELGQKTEDPEMQRAATHRAVAQRLRKHWRIVFNGDGYSESWVREAAERGLQNIHNTPAALKLLVSRKNLELLPRHGVFSPQEVYARHEVYAEEFMRRICIEGRTLLQMFHRDILPAVLEYEATLRASLTPPTAAPEEEEEAPVSPSPELLNLGERIRMHRDNALRDVAALEKELDLADTWKRGVSCHSEQGYRLYQAQVETLDENVVPLLRKIRSSVDSLELLIPAKLYPFPTYLDMLYQSPN